MQTMATWNFCYEFTLFVEVMCLGLTDPPGKNRREYLSRTSDLPKVIHTSIRFEPEAFQFSFKISAGYKLKKVHLTVRTTSHL